MAGIDFAVLQKHLAADSLQAIHSGLTGMLPDTLWELGGFTVTLKPKQILLIPPGMITVELALSSSNIVSWWCWLQPGHISALLKKASGGGRRLGLRGGLSLEVRGKGKLGT